MTPGIRDFHSHVAAIVSGLKVEWAVPKQVRNQVKMALFEAVFRVSPDDAAPELPVVAPPDSVEQCLDKFSEILGRASPRFLVEIQDNRAELLALIECFSRPEWRNAAPIDDHNWPMQLGIYDHFKGGVYKVRGVSYFASGNMEEVVEYTSMSLGKDCTRFHWEWDEIVKWPDGKYRSRFVYRGPSLETPEPSFKVQLK